jgi:hypothetical protein
MAEKSELILNALISSKPLDVVIEYLKNKDLIGASLLFEKQFYDMLRGKLRYILSKYLTDTSFIGLIERPVDKYVKLIIVSMIRNIIDRIQNELKGFEFEKFKYLTSIELSKMLSDKISKYYLLDSYIKLAFRNFLQKTNRKPIIRSSCWKDGDIFVCPDIDLDPKDFYAYISVEIRKISPSVWDLIIDKKISRMNLQELVGKRALVPYGQSFVWGLVADFIRSSISEYYVEWEGEKIGLYDYYTKKKNIKLDPKENLVVKVKMPQISGKGEEELVYPPSQVRIIYDMRTELQERYNYIEEILGEILENFKLFDIEFMNYHAVSHNYINPISQIRLLYYNNITTSHSPIVAIQRDGAKLLRGIIKIENIYMLLPKELMNDENLIESLIKIGFKEYNLGEINCVSSVLYEDSKDSGKSDIEFIEKLNDLVKRAKPNTDVIVPIIKYNKFYEYSKIICSQKNFNARVIELKTISKILKIAKELGLKDPKNLEAEIKQIIKRSEGMKEKRVGELISTLFNILISIYVEFNIQSSIYKGEIPSDIAWKLAEPADGVGESIYIGFDVSRKRDERSAGAIFVLYDSLGSMLNAKTIMISGERLTYEDITNTLLELLKVKTDLLSRINRIVLLKDGPIRSYDEYNNVIRAFENVGVKLDFKFIDFIGVVKRHNLRLFEKTATKIVNPKRGVWTSIWSIRRPGIEDVERALIVSSSVETGRTGAVKPIIIERYKSKYSSNRNINDIAKEYLYLCRLNFWNGIDGLSKLPLPLKMADTLAYLTMIGVPIKTP